MSDFAQPPIWRLRTNHYLNTPNTFYVKREIDGETGEQVEHRYPVPRLIEIDDKKYHNGGPDITLASTDEKAKLINGRIIIFAGEPTPDMDPQNEAAEAISASFRDKWLKPFEELHTTGGTGINFAKDLETALQRILDTASAGKQTAVVNAPTDVIAELQSQMAKLMDQNASMAGQLAALAEKPVPKAPAEGRRA